MKNTVFVCKNCKFVCSYNSEYERHLSTRKHLLMLEKQEKRVGKKKEKKYVVYPSECKEEWLSQSRVVGDNVGVCEKQEENITELSTSSNEENIKIDVDVGAYGDFVPNNEENIRVGKKQIKNSNNEAVCKENNDTVQPDVDHAPSQHSSESTEWVKELVVQYREIKELLHKQKEDMEELKQRTQPGNHIAQPVHSNVGGEHFNLSYFLNGKCGGAMNIKDFEDSIELKFQELEMVGRLGYVEGITKIIMAHTSKLGMFKRPFHCTDKKREKMYVREGNEWKREKEEKESIVHLIETISSKNIKLIPEWHRCNPESQVQDTAKYNQYIKIMVEAIGGRGGSSEYMKSKNYGKIIRNIIQHIYVEKDKTILST